jgi:xanthine/uracil permease
MFLMIMGIFSKFAAALVSIPASVLGGMTTFLFCAVAVSGMAIINRVPFNRRTRFILTASLALGYGATLVPTWFSHVFTYEGDNRSLKGFMNAIELVMETGFAITAFVAMILNLSIGEEIEADAKQLEGHHIPQTVMSHQNGSKAADVGDIEVEKGMK